MTSPTSEIEALIAGTSPHERAEGREPSLLPVLARHASSAGLLLAAQFARNVCNGRWPLLRDRIAASIAARMAWVSPDELREILWLCPFAARLLPESQHARVGEGYPADRVIPFEIRVELARARDDVTRLVEYARELPTRPDRDTAPAVRLFPYLDAEARQALVARIAKEPDDFPAGELVDLVSRPGAPPLPAVATEDAKPDALLTWAAGYHPTARFESGTSLADVTLRTLAGSDVTGRQWYLAELLERAQPFGRPDLVKEALACFDGFWREGLQRRRPWQPAHPLADEIRSLLAELPVRESTALADDAIRQSVFAWGLVLTLPLMSSLEPPEAVGALMEETAAEEPSVSEAFVEEGEENGGGDGQATEAESFDVGEAEAALPQASEEYVPVGTGSGPPTDVESFDVGAAESPGPPTDARPRAADQRKVQAEIEYQGSRRSTFVAARQQLLRCWIGLDERDEQHPHGVADAPIPSVAIPQEGIRLAVELVFEGQRQQSSLLLKPSGRTGDCEFPLEIPEGMRFASIDLVFRYKNRVFEAVQVTAAVVVNPEDETARDAIDVRVQAHLREIVQLGERPELGLVYLSTSHGLIPLEGQVRGNPAGLSHTTAAVEWLNNELTVSERAIVRRLENAAPAAEPRLDANDVLVKNFLRTAAIHGNLLYREIGGPPVGFGVERIQIVGDGSYTLHPLEFVYDRGWTSQGASLCDGWEEALATGSCPSCTPAMDLSERERLELDKICPLGFWSLQKVIERRIGGEDAGADAPAPGRTTLGPIDSAVFAASVNVKDNDREETVASFTTRFPQHFHEASSWDEWIDIVRDFHPRLLVALPHHGISAAKEPYLEVSRDLLGLGQICRLHVSTEDGTRPILLLLGCKTRDEAEFGYQSMAGAFHRNRAAIVVGTLAKVLGRHAAPMARELAERLSAVGGTGIDFGAALRETRRQALLRGHLMALCVTAIGDADWQIAPTEE